MRNWPFVAHSARRTPNGVSAYIDGPTVTVWKPPPPAQSTFLVIPPGSSPATTVVRRGSVNCPTVEVRISDVNQRRPIL